jgi:hypothetical protein
MGKGTLHTHLIELDILKTSNVDGYCLGRVLTIVI